MVNEENKLSVYDNLKRFDELLGGAEDEYLQYLLNTNEITLGFDQNPLPMWVKSWPSLTMLAVNQSYRDRVGKDAFDYVGKTDYAVWDQETASKFRGHDEKVGKIQQAICFMETWEQPTGRIRSFVVKYPIIDHGKLKAIGGIIIDESLLKGELPSV